MKKILWFTLLAAAVTSLVFSNGASDSAKTEKTAKNKVYTMQIGHAQPVENPRHVSLTAFKKIVEEKTNGGVKVELYPAGQLGTEKEMLEQACSGVIQGFRGGQMDFLPKLLVFSLPFLCENSDQITRLMSSDLAREMCKGSQKDGVLILGLCDAGGFRQFSNNKRPIKSPKDLVGLKMRTNGMDTIDKTFKAMGASTVAVPYADLYMALKTGVADGQENPWVNVRGMKFYEVQKYFTAINYQFHPDPFYVNLEWWNSLPADYQKIIQEAANESFKVNNKAIADMQQSALDTVKANAEVYFPTAEEMAEFKKATEVVYKQYLSSGMLTQSELDQMRAIVAGK
ncbi:TRAP transporter substrate-binding protein [Treponema parvum]|uniref:TRAP transporter substrate-binding protein n=1 Tax=Treponema parvum TaxID=138851 RepID=A0A975EXQ5_9SPIR|nr:TRAP transporter substrate-binding protein [Treponema parvum]QTQ10772.1 TRAP transporter substrate-binding protein [Treponema parvum]